MASGSNGELHCGNINKRSSDNNNGYKPQWKPRKVSAVRDFPPGCGPNSVAINSKAAENCGNGASVFKPEMVNATVRIGVDCCKMADGGATEIPKFFNTQQSGMDAVEDLTMQTRHRATEFTARVDCELHEAISDPVEGDTAESLNAVVGTLATVALEGELNYAEDFIIKTGPLGVGLCNDLERDAFNNVCEDGCQTTVNEVEHLELLQNSKVKGKLSHSSSPEGLNVSARVELETARRPKDKYRRRRVSAVRDFPPLCGTNAPQPTKEERRMFTCENDYLDEVKRKVVALSNESNRIGKEVGSSKKMKPSDGVLSLVDEADRKAVRDMVAAPYGTWKKAKVGCDNSDGKARKQIFWGPHKVKAVAKKSYAKSKFTGGASMNHKVLPSVAGGIPGALVLADKRGYGHEAFLKPEGIKAIMPLFGPKSFSHGDARKRVRETLRLFHAICRKLLREEVKSMHEQREKSRQPKKGSRRIDLLAANFIKGEGKEVNTGKILGEVPGVQVGDEFQYRVELAVVGIHRLYQNGIDSIKLNGNMSVATSIVASGVYADDMESGDVLIYSGQGGNVVDKDKEPEDQKLEKGNLALKNSISAKTPVRVVRGWKVKTADSKTAPIYIYDGLYTVKRFWMETGPHGKLVFMFELWRNPGQPELAWKELKRSNKSKTRTGICVNDISGGKEASPISAVNILNNEKPPPFSYISKMMYPDWYHPISPKGCDCTGRCSDSRKCQCAAKNGGEIPYNRNGAIVEIKPLVYECGPSCKCPPSCYNRVSQRGIKFQLEIFKTESRGWGVRSLNSISSGSFICEYSGELLEDKEAERRGDDDEYLFAIGQNFNDSSLIPEEQAMMIDYWEGVFTIDAARYGNVGRFMNHSCSPNLYAQNVVYDHGDERMAHVMLFAAENIPPFQELTCHYNYKMGQVCDSNGNIKTKKCFCVAPECSGRMY